MKCKYPIEKNEFLKVPCGTCVACRINETTDWSIRALYELHDFENASFVTLTYNEENYPKDCSVHKEVLSDWWDNFQHKVKKEKGISPRIFSCGEYGSRTNRAHYHAILYGLNPDPFDKHNYDRELIANSWKFCDRDMFLWNRYDFNKNAINFCTRETIQYVAGYIQKKLKSYQAKEVYEKFGKQAPFKLASKSLGLNYAIENQDMLKNNGFCVYNGYRVRIPRYFREKLGIKPDIEGYDERVNALIIKNHMLDKEVQDKRNTYDFQFKAWLDSKNLPVNEIDKPEYADLRLRLFNWWYETKLADAANFAEREFQQKCRFNAKEL